MAPQSRTMSGSSMSGNSITGLPQTDSMRFNMPPPSAPPGNHRNQEISNFRADVPPPNISKPPPIVKPDTAGGQNTQVRYPKEALNRSEKSLSSSWSKTVSEKSFDFGGSAGNQVC